MKKEFDQARGITWVDDRVTHSDVSKQTQKQFEPVRDEQLKALMLQVKALSEAAGVNLVPAFEQAIQQRETIMADHQARKSEAIPD